MAKLLGEAVAKTAGAHARDRQPAGCHNQRLRLHAALAGLYVKSIAATLHRQHLALGADLHTGRFAFVQQHAYDLLGRDIAEQLAQLFLVIGNGMPFDHLYEICRAVACQRGFAEVPIGRNEIAGSGAGIGEIAAPAAGHQDLLADLVGMVDHQHLAAAPAGSEGAHQSGGAGTDHQHVATHAHSAGACRTIGVRVTLPWSASICTSPS